MSAVSESDDVIRTDPELARLAALRVMGWSFQPLSDEHGLLAGIVGWRRAGDVTDTLSIFDRTDCRAVRVVAPGEIVWSYTGDLTACIDELLGHSDTRPARCP
jgi:hypothetical protein